MIRIAINTPNQKLNFKTQIKNQISQKNRSSHFKMNQTQLKRQQIGTESGEDKQKKGWDVMCIESKTFNQTHQTKMGKTPNQARKKR